MNRFELFRYPWGRQTDLLMIFGLFYHQSMQLPGGIELARYPDFRPTATDDDW
ncbi:hypothetical protein [Bradyrhizobium sp.]|uniref:hypothetical protein n=1 Tax=Bradyrhizobium sp. TaxID=376 RepID=UPI003BB01597